MLELIARMIEANVVWINGFIMAGVILILVGVQNITSKDLNEYKLSHRNIHKIDIVIAWGVFYIIFGTLITVAGVVSIYPYL
ncbi:hypothetical protein A2803_00625 [Candidatus Woesebacteria bacterium RIFCSPHIGHO2_01_FULL_44_21]|uniref:Uncharacterized protein n=1 Tax=Candidatus Woesebacteria bacterium RIFCSPHIGHO2_01_FULL_44_21 TaxID=1802503 RepID=A0A1F7YXR8_9BACT|nr:MAG: hypothetical protein A2803_00625 [Candidatus Woesebacteria bacterium RIFCSPHIGHO2_01_FULL_44_21]OGM70367.1 MAG: hypothetical protein A2897_01055 [Candidatus Woesebacteria bacterium RIFCSPLOWO2_01_FULL_44_24b]